MWKKILTMSLVLVMVLSFTACAEEIEEEVELPSAQEIVDGVIESFDNIRTYQFDIDMTMDMTGEAEGEAFEQTVTMDNSGTLDLENVQMRADLTMNVNMVTPEEDEMEMGVEFYIIDGMMYAMPEAPEEEPAWMKEEVPAEAWEKLKGIGGLENYKELLKTAQVKVIGSEKVKGVDCYVLQLTPDMAQLWQIAMEPTGVGEEGILPTVPEESLQEIFRSFSVKQWIAKDTYFLMKAEIDMAVESTPELMDYLGEEGEMTFDLTMSFLAYNYNQPVSIVLPPEAEEEAAVVEVEEEEAPKPDEWTASTGSSQFTFTFTVSPDSTGITEIYYGFFAFECAGWVGTITPSTVEKSPPCPITGGQFTIEISRSPQYGQGLDLDIVIQGSFDETGTHASGTWEISVEGTTCPAGTWEASPNS